MRLAGVSEAAKILGWDRRKVATYIKRGMFPEPFQRLACGPIWPEETILQFKQDRESLERWRRPKKTGI